MEIWIIAGICAFLIFIAGIVILFFPAKRKIGAILTSAGMLLLVSSIIGVIVSFSHYQQVQNEVFNYSSTASNQAVEETKTYQVNYEDTADNFKRKITSVTVEKKETYSTVEGKSVPGSITLALEITNNADKTLETYPNQGQLEANKMEINGGDAVLSEFEKTEIEPGETVKGKIVFPVEKLDKVSDITWISYSFLSYLKDSSTPLTTETGKIELK
ncbi:hypothetical protein [Listeria seeligeri]|uniref:hypothetical protein n=1 Tax=Listeria seeligeri TaxID=1640 RepID=UPI001944D5EA|nr:hypothetical protein [Listeria seeligeri]MBM5610610.1 hypothetical protein [Listeria seeligeri]